MAPVPQVVEALYLMGPQAVDSLPGQRLGEDLGERSVGGRVSRDARWDVLHMHELALRGGVIEKSPKVQS